MKRLRLESILSILITMNGILGIIIASCSESEFGLFFGIAMFILSAVIWFAVAALGTDWLPGFKKIRKDEDEKYIWFLRWAEPQKSDYKYLKDVDEYLKAKEEWDAYHCKRKEYLSRLMEVQSKTGKPFQKILFEYYVNHRVNDLDYAIVINDMNRDKIVMFYRPTIDYIAINGPVWADNPSKISEYNLYDRYFIFNHTNINRVVMDHSKYYNKEYLLKEARAYSEK